MRFSLGGYGCVLAVLVLACGDSAPCTRCPSLEGTYATTWAAGSGACGFSAPEPNQLTFTREASTVHTTFGGQSLGGTLYDTYDFVLSGGVAPSYRLRGRVVVGLPDSGTRARITGTMTTRETSSDGGTCAVDESFEGTKI